MLVFPVFEVQNTQNGIELLLKKSFQMLKHKTKLG